MNWKMQVFNHQTQKGKRCFYKNHCISIFLLSVLLHACGIDTYVYLTPVQNISVYTNTMHTSFRLPDNQDPIYCSKYVIYYRIYRSKTVWTSISLDSTSYATINSQLSRDYNSIATNITDEERILASISYLENNFFQADFYEAEIGALYYPLGLNAEKTDLLSRNFLFDDLFFTSVFEIDFSMTTYNFAFPVIRHINPNPDVFYRLTRDTVAGIEPEKDFLFPNQIKGPDTVSFSQSEEGEHAYVLLYIVAQGNNDDYSPVSSAPGFLGIFPIRNP